MKLYLVTSSLWFKKYYETNLLIEKILQNYSKFYYYNPKRAKDVREDLRMT